MSMKRLFICCLLTVLLIAAGLLSACSKPLQETDTESETKLQLQETPSQSETETETEAITETETETEPVDTSADGTDRSFLLYLSGIDVWGATETESRSDVNILMAVNRDTHKVQIVNTPRDYYVPLPVSGGSRDKLTHAGLYGIDNSMGALESLYGVDIDYYVRLNFSGFEAIIDAIGGIDVYSEYDFTVDPIKHYTEGMNHLTGLESLAFVRERKSFAEGDVQRGKDQMEIVKALIGKFTQEETLRSYDQWMDEALRLLYQTNIPSEMMASLMKEQLHDKTEWEIETYYVTGFDSYEYTYSIPDMEVYVMIPNEDEVAKGGRLLNEVLTEKSQP